MQEENKAEENVEKMPKNKIIKTIAIILKAILFLFIGILIMQVITPIFVPKWNKPGYAGITRQIRGIYKEPTNTIDVVIMGNSDAYFGISTMKLWEDYGIKSYNLGMDMQTTWSSYYIAKEIYKKQKPKLAIIEVDYLFEDEDRSKEQVLRTMSNIKLGINKIKMINNPIYNITDEHKLEYILPIMKFHSRWSKLNKEDFEKIYTPFKGYRITTKVKPGDNKENYMEENNKEVNIPEKSAEYMKKLIKFCKANNTEVLLITVPTANTWSYQKNELVNRFANENGVEYLDLNMDNKTVGIDWKKDSPDEGNHLNVYGAEKTAKYIGKYISEKYQLIDYRNSPDFEEWNENLKLYYKVKQDLYEKTKDINQKIQEKIQQRKKEKNKDGNKEKDRQETNEVKNKIYRKDKTWKTRQWK